MNPRTTLITVSIAVLLAASGSAFAAGEGGGSASDNGATGSGAAANGVHPAPMRGVEQGAAATSPSASSAAGTHASKHLRTRTSSSAKHHMTKPANDTTNMPGADASSDTKGH
ncbi:MAG TPA: hypothetical protein VGG24_15785 [Paraburkholderia sp.]